MSTRKFLAAAVLAMLAAISKPALAESVLRVVPLNELKNNSCLMQICDMV